MTIGDKIDSLVSERALLLAGKKSLSNSVIPATEEKNLILDYITNDTLNIGVLDMLSLLAQELKTLSNITFNKPNISTGMQLSYSLTLEQKLEAVSAKDDNDIFLTSDPSKINENSGWIKNNGMGSESFDNSEMKTAIDDILEGLSGLREERASVDPSDPFVLIHPDFYGNPYKAKIENNILIILNKLGTVEGLTESLEYEIDNIPNNIFLSNPNISNEEITSLKGFNAIVQGLIYDLTAIQTFFQTKSSGVGYNRTEFDAFISSGGTVENYLSSLVTKVQARISELKGHFSNNNYGLRKWYIFWINLLIGKPQASMLSYVGILTALDNTNKSLELKFEQLKILFGEDYNRYLPTPNISSVYHDEDNNTVILVDSLPCFDSFTLYCKKINKNTILSNNDYSESDEVEPMDVFIDGLTITDVSDLDENSLYLYRIKIHDNSIDSHPTGSQQSPILGSSYSYYTNGDSELRIFGGHDFSVGQHIYISGKGIFSIVSKTPSSITVDSKIDSSGILTRVNGLIFT